MAQVLARRMAKLCVHELVPTQVPLLSRSLSATRTTLSPGIINARCLHLSSRKAISPSQSGGFPCDNVSPAIAINAREGPLQISMARNNIASTFARSLSSVSASRTDVSEVETPDYGATQSLGSLLTAEQAEKFATFAHVTRYQKVKPFIVKRRLGRLRTYVGTEKGIRHSPWRMNLVCQFAAGQTVPDALKQLMFCQKVKAPLMAKVIRRTSNLASIRHGLQPSQLEVAECFATHGTHLKRLKIMGRGRSGIKHHRHSHIRLVLREIDFPLKLVQAKSLNKKKRWLERLEEARRDYEKAKSEREELAELEAQAAKVEVEARKKKEENQ